MSRFQAVRMVSGLKSKDYHQRLAEQGMTTLEERRREIDMVQTFKIVNGIDKVNSQDWFTKAVNRGTRGTSGLDNLVKPRSEHEYRRHFFSQRVVDEWNSLPDHVIEARNVPCFKRLYRRTRLTAGPAWCPDVRRTSGTAGTPSRHPHHGSTRAAEDSSTSIQVSISAHLDGSQSLTQVVQKARGSYNSSADTFVFNFLPTVSCRKNNRFKYFPKGGRSVNKFRKSANFPR
jgi:hypothetical protein